MVRIQVGFEEAQRDTAAALYAEAFERKLHRVMGDRKTLERLFKRGMDRSSCIAAYDSDGRLVGIAGYQSSDTSLLRLNRSHFIQEFGFWRGTVRAFLSALLFRRSPRHQKELVMDGIVVDASQRGKGIGGMLFSALVDYARAQGRREIRLDVIDENPDAKRLYENIGFRTIRYQRVPRMIQRLIGVSGVSTMVRSTDPMIKLGGSD